MQNEETNLRYPMVHMQHFAADERFPEGDVPEHDFEQKFLPEKSAPFVLLGGRAQPYNCPWAHLWDYLTTEKWLLRLDLSG